MSINQIQAGRYVGKAVGTLAFSEDKNGGERVGLRFELLNEGYEGRTVIWRNGITTEVGIDIMMKTLRNAGWTGDDLTACGPDTGLGSKEVELAVYYEQYQGKQQMQVQVFALGGGTIFKEDKLLDERRVAALNARLKGAIIKSMPKTTAAAPVPSFFSRPSQSPPRQSADGWDGTGAAPYVDADNDGREGYLPTGSHVEAPPQDNGEIPGF